MDALGHSSSAGSTVLGSKSSLPSNLRMRNNKDLSTLLKKELRLSIMAKRQARGEGDITVEFSEPADHELTPEELEKKERRREQNRRAAQRCRKKKRMNQMTVIQSYEWVIARNQQLLREVHQLRLDKNAIHSLLEAHLKVCTCTDRQSVPIKVEPEEERAASLAYPSSPLTSSALLPFQHMHQKRDPFPANSSEFDSKYLPVEPPVSSYDHTQQDLKLPDHFRQLSTTDDLTSINHTLTTECRTPIQAEPYAFPKSKVPNSTLDQVSSRNAHFTYLQDLAFADHGPCVFERDALTPHSADGRCSISSVSSDASGVSEQSSDVQTTSENPEDIPSMLDCGYMTETDVSRLLSVVTNELLDDVFADGVDRTIFEMIRQ